MPKTVWIMAGEASGEAYGALLARELWRLEPDVVLRGMGGEAMAEAGVDLLVDSSELGIVGFIEVIKHIRLFIGLMRRLTQRAATERPDAVVLIDYPGFNLRFARRLHALGIPVVYYISPQVWAWGKRRIAHIARLVDKMLVIFPFEPEVYAGTGLDVEFVGHPLLEVLAPVRDQALTCEPDTVLLLPGSRTSEIDRLLDVMCACASLLVTRRPGTRFVIAAPRATIAAHIRARLAQRYLDSTDAPAPDLEVVVGRTREWMRRACVGLAASGTVTVEAAILGLPLVVVYRLHWFTCWLARHLVRVPYFTMINLVANDMVFEEFLQDGGTPERLSKALEDILPGGSRRAAVEAGMNRTVAALGVGERATHRAALAVLDVAARRQDER